MVAGNIRVVRKFAAYLKRFHNTATVAELRQVQRHRVDAGNSPITLNAVLTGLKFFFDLMLDGGELMARMQPLKLPRTLPVELNMPKPAGLIAPARNGKHHAALWAAHGAGSRVPCDSGAACRRGATCRAVCSGAPTVLRAHCHYRSRV